MCAKECKMKPVQLQLPFTADPYTNDPVTGHRWTLELNKYQRDNLLELIDTGDWFQEIRNILKLGPPDTQPNPMVRNR